MAALDRGRPHEDPPAPEPDNVRARLARLLRSDAFANAPSLRRLLSYVVDRTLEGQGDGVKEYAIGVDVFDRGESFDPRTDTIVRVQARRLRAKLEEYYQGEGAADAVRIEIPKGGYLPRFLAVPASERRDVAEAPPGWCWRRPGDDPAIAESGAFPVLPPPTPRTPLIGRELELARVRGLLLDEGVGLVTLVGPGGSGKTRLALQVASDGLEDYPGGVLFVGLGSVSDFRDVAPAAAQALGLRRIECGSIEAALRTHVRQRIAGRTLLVLDNFEQLLPAAPLLAALAESSALLRILVTSRSVLRVSGEQCFQVPPLDVPDLSAPPSVQALAANPAVALFVQRAAAGQVSFALTAENARAIAEICARVDGLPLAIELAAAQIRVLSPLQMQQRLESRLGVLTGGACDLPARQQTLRNTIDWSHELLGRTEKRLFRRLSVFAGSWTIEGAEAVCNARRDLEVPVLEAMSSLVDKSLIRQVADDHGELRFAMLETVREYAHEQLDAGAERAAGERAHAAYCIVLAEEGLSALAAADRAAWLARCDREHDNHRAALDHLIGSDDGAWALRLAQALFPYWDRREQRAEGHARLEAILGLRSLHAATRARATALALASLLAPWGEAAPRAREALAIYRRLGDLRGIVGQLNNLGVNSRLRGDCEDAQHWLEQSLRACRELGDRAMIASALSNLADVASGQGKDARARTLLQEALELFRDVGHRTGQAWSLNHLGDLERARGQLGEARRHYQDGAEIFRSLGDSIGVGRSAVDLGYLASEQGDFAAAHALFAEALQAFMASDHKLGVAIALEAFACAAVQQERHDRALTLAGAAAAVRRTIGSLAMAAADQRARFENRLATAWGPDRAQARSKWEAGWAMPFERAVAYALGRLGSSPPEISRPSWSLRGASGPPSRG